MYQQIWKDIPTWEGIYQCSNFGRIKRFYKHVPQKIYIGTKNKYGYYVFSLVNGKRKTIWEVHRLVATVFQRPLLQTQEAHHKNKFRFCNCCYNIQIIDENEHAHLHSGRKQSEETKEKIRQARLGTKRSEETKKKLSEITKKNYQLHPQRREQNSKRLKQHPVQKDLLTGRFLSSK